MLEKRRSMIAVLGSTEETICSQGQQHAVNEVEAALDKEHAKEDAQSQAAKDERETAYRFVSKSLGSRNNSRLPANQAIKRTFDQVNQLRSGLTSDPVKDSSGQLVIPAVTPLQCKWSD